MATTGESLGKTVELMFDIAIYGKKTYQKVKSSAPAYLKALAKGVAIWFLIIFASIILKALTGWPWFAYIGVGLCFYFRCSFSIFRLTTWHSNWYAKRRNHQSRHCRQ